MPIALPAPKLYTPFLSGDFRMELGLHALDLAEWIEIDANLGRELALKHDLLTQRPDEVFMALPQADAGAEETLALLVAHLVKHFPFIFEKEGDLLRNRTTGACWDLAACGLHPLDLAGRLVQEDLCLMAPDAITGEYRLVGASVCFPSRWRPAEKLGRNLDGIHGPVPRYEPNMSSPMQRFFAKVKPDRSVWRVGWSVADSPDLFLPGQHGGAQADVSHITADNAGESLWLRVERQTLRRLPQSGQILFTIRIYVTSLADAARNPADAADLAESFRNMAPDFRAYKGITPVADAAIAWLDRAAEGKIHV